MKNLQFEVTLPERGKTPGTTAWLTSKLADLKLAVSSTKRGHPAIFAKEFRSTAIVLCNHEPMQQGPGWKVENIGNGRYIHICPTCGEDTEDPLFSFLTPAAQGAAQDFIGKCVTVLRQFIEEN